jgi:hypothetical protein
MALEGELDIAKFCPDCKRPMPVKVCRSGAGYYIGQYCDYCGPYNRLSYNYYRTQEEAQKLLETGKWKPRDTNYHPGPITIIGVKKTAMSEIACDNPIIAIVIAENITHDMIKKMSKKVIKIKRRKRINE